jgi:arsenate reductase
MSASAPPYGVPPAVPPGLVTACRDLAARYRGIFSPETVLRTVYESYQLFVTTSGRKVDAVPDVGDDVGGDAVAEATGFAADWLADAASSITIARAPRAPSVLFVCLHDTGRAQMAEALLRRRAGDRVAVRSAGPVAGRAVQPAVVAAMAELGIGISAEYPEPLLDDVVRAADVVVTMGCGDICPVYVGKRYLDWPLRGAMGSGIAAIRSVRDQIDVYVERLLREMPRRPPLRDEHGRLDHGGGLHARYN